MPLSLKVSFDGYDVAAVLGGNKSDEVCPNHVGGTATCTEKGKCELCGKEYIPMIEHDTEIRGAKEATADEEGYTGDTVCKVCDTVVSKGESIPKLEAPSTEPTTKPLGGLIAVVVIGSVVAVTAGGFAIFWFVVKKKE